MWGGWLVVTGLVFSYMEGIIHPYYTVALAPAIAALVAIGGRELWRVRTTVAGRIGLVAMTIAAGGWSYVLLGRTSSWHPELRDLVAAATALTVIGLLIPARRLATAIAVTGLVAALAGTGSFAAATAARAHTGSIPSVGPAVAQTSDTGTGGGTGGQRSGSGAPSGGTRPSGTAPGASTSTGTLATGTSSTDTGSTSTGTASTSAGDAATTTAALTKALAATTTTWAAAVVGDQSAAQLELDSGTAVIAIGGWSGSDASPTLAQFKALVAAGKITYFIASGTGGRWQLERRGQSDHGLGRGALHGHHHRRPNGLCPDGQQLMGRTGRRLLDQDGQLRESVHDREVAVVELLGGYGEPQLREPSHQCRKGQPQFEARQFGADAAVQAVARRRGGPSQRVGFDGVDLGPGIARITIGPAREQTTTSPSKIVRPPRSHRGARSVGSSTCTTVR